MNWVIQNTDGVLFVYKVEADGEGFSWQDGVWIPWQAVPLPAFSSNLTISRVSILPWFVYLRRLASKPSPNRVKLRSE